MDYEWIREHVKCCACGGSLKKSKHINGIFLDKLATWEFPVWWNILVKEKHPEKRATAIVCDECVEKKIKVKFAIEWDEQKNVKYHSVEELKDLQPITEEEVIEAEQRKMPLKFRSATK